MAIENPVTSLKERLQEVEQVTRQTGYYCGLKDVYCRSADPVKYEIFASRLLSAAISSREASIGVAASPMLVEGRDNLFGLYTPEGDAIAFSEGLLIHITTISTFIKSMIRDGFEDDPGINEGDIFANNEIWYGAVHLPDLQMVMPLFYAGEFIGWVGSVFHEFEAGTFEGGSIAVLIPERFGEGVHFCREKVGVGDKFLRYYRDRVRLNTRNPELWILDDKARYAGMHFLRRRIKEVIDEFGLDYYKAATREMIEEKRREFLASIKERLVPGRYRSSLTMYLPFEDLGRVHPLVNRNWLHLVPVETRVLGEGKVVLDYEGASKWGFHVYNSLPVHMASAGYMVILQCIGYEGLPNSGTGLCVEHRCPKGSIANVDYPYASTAIPMAVTAVPHNMNHLAIAHFARGFLEEVFMTGPVSFLQGAGQDQYGRTSGWFNVEFGAQGSGARGVLDGLDSAYALFNPESDQGNSEIWELHGPFLYLGRSFIKNHHGYGMFRGGASWGSLFMFWKTDRQNVVSVVLFAQIPYAKGLFGGYPAPPWYTFILYDTNMAELIGQGKKLPHSTDEALAMLREGHLKGRGGLIDKPLLSDRMKQFDLFSSTCHGGAGYGDPLERHLSLILKDLTNGIIDEQGARLIYGVMARREGNEWRIDEEASQREGQRRREERLRQGTPVKEWWRKERARLRDGALSEPVRQMYKESFELSKPFQKRMQEFWQLPQIQL